MRQIALAVSLFLPISALCQTTPLRRSVRAVGEGTVSARPDQARVSLSVVTQATTASDAASRNATAATNVINELRKLLGGTADIRTINYNLSPNFGPSRDQNPPVITGYTATNTVQATVIDLALVGRVIDAGIAAGANRVNGLTLSLRDEDTLRAQALRIAGQKARAKAEAIAQGLGLRLGNVIVAEETGGISAPFDLRSGITTAVTTPIEPGLLQVEARVAVEFEILL